MTTNSSIALNLGCLRMLNLSTYEVANIGADHTNAIQTLVEECEPYKYVRNRTKNGSAYHHCSQKRHHGQVIESYSGASILSKQRRRESMRIYCCSGFISVRRPKKGTVSACVGHDGHHPRAISLPKLTEQSMNRIEQLTELGFALFQISNVMRAEGSSALWHQTHYRWASSQRQQYFKQEDAFMSCFSYVQQGETLQTLFEMHSLRSIAFFAKFAEHII